MVEPQPAGEPGDEPVVDRTTGDGSGPLQVVEAQGDHVEVTTQAPGRHHRRQRLRDGCDRADDRLCGGGHDGCGLQRVPGSTEGGGHRGKCLEASKIHDPFAVVNEAVANQTVSCDRLACGRVRHRSWLLGRHLEVEELQGELHPADSVGERVVDLHHQRGSITVKVLDECEFPERVAGVERRRRRVARDVYRCGRGVWRG